jgi:hypothetical protein
VRQLRLQADRLLRRAGLQGGVRGCWVGMGGARPRSGHSRV